MTRPVASHPVEAPPPQVCAAWTDLLARLLLAAVACRQAQTRRQLQAFGVRRTGTAGVNLAREQATAQRMAATAGVQVPALTLQRRVGELARPGPLAWHLRGLATAYQQLLDTPALPMPLSAWLQGRCRVHLAQAEAMEHEAVV